MRCQPKCANYILSENQDEIRSDIGDGSITQGNHAVVKEVRIDVQFYSSPLMMKPIYLEGLGENFSTVAESKNRRRSRNSIKTLDPSGKEGLKNNVISTPTADSFIEAAATMKAKLPKDSEVASWEKFISSVSQDHKNETKRG